MGKARRQEHEAVGQIASVHRETNAAIRVAVSFSFRPGSLPTGIILPTIKGRIPISVNLI